VGFGACIVQIGFQVVPDLLSFKPERLSPAEGMGKIFSIVGIGKGVLAILKVAALGALAWIIIKNRVPGLAQLGQSSVGHAATGAWDMVMQLALWLAGAMFAVGALDYAWQRFRFERALRMTKQEVKEEAKREEGDPQMRGRIRQIQRDTARKRMMTKVPKATVVVTNPVHIAVAIEYQRGKKGAPRVVAKGRGLIAERIRELAVEHGIPVLERAPLARALYRAVKLDQEIPSALYQAVAEVLTVVYTTSQRSEVRR
jgi:flagellar biosynthetic protein FlhB